jgi:hypothetical protein
VRNSQHIDAKKNKVFNAQTPSRIPADKRPQDRRHLLCPKANDEGYKAEVAKERVETVCIVRVVGFRSHESRYLPLLDRSMHLRQLCHCRDLYADAPSKAGPDDSN